MTTSLNGTWSLVLGSSSGMGLAIAGEIARAGGNVLGVHLDTAAAADAVSESVDQMRSFGGQVEFVNANAASAATREQVVARLVDVAGDTGVRLLVHSLAFGSLVPFLPDGQSAGVTQRQLDMTLSVMAHSLVYWTQDVFSAKLLRGGAKVLAMTSAGDARVSPSYGPVSAAKCALQAHVRQLAMELAPYGVAVNALRAGVTLTPSLQRIPEHEALVERARSSNPHGRLTTTQDVAEAAVLLAGTDSSWITGNVIGVDGGEALTT